MEFAQAIELIRGRIEQEFMLGYPLLRRIPDEYVWRHMAVVDCLAPNERSDLFDLLAERGCLFLETDIDGGERVQRSVELSKNIILIRYRNSVATQYPWKYADSRYLHMCLDNWRRRIAGTSVLPNLSTPPVKQASRSIFRHADTISRTSFNPVPFAIVEAAEPPNKCQAPKIRAAVKQIFANRFKISRSTRSKAIGVIRGNFRIACLR